MIALTHHLLISALCALTFYVQTKHPHLIVHYGALTLITNMLWVWAS
jgi:hypothetical protein